MDPGASAPGSRPDIQETCMGIFGGSDDTGGERGNGERMVQCVKLGRELPGLEEKPWPGDLGQRIYDNVSAEAWRMWEERMKMILNEYRLLPWQKEAQELVARHMEDFFFGESAALPPGYVPPPQGK
jgi:Fe-S cluster biosynthesis and repair protein YggX